MSFGHLKEQQGSRIDFSGIGRGLVAAFRFAENGGTKLYDAAGNNHYQASFLNTPTWSVGPRGPAVAFSGTAEATLLNLPISIIRNGATIVCLGMSTSSANQAFYTNGDGSGSGYFGLGIGGVVGFAPYLYGSSSMANVSGSALVSGQWCHMVGVFHGNYRELWQNGMRKVRDTSGWGVPTITSRADIASFGAAASTLQGRIDHVYVFNRALGPSEIIALYADPDIILYKPRKIVLFPPPVNGSSPGITFDALTTAASVTVVNPVTGTAADTLANLTSTGSATVANPISGTASFTLGDLTEAGSATIINPITGTASFTFGDLTVAGSATYSTKGTASITFDALTTAASATVINPITGTASLTFDALTAVSSATVGIAATSAITFDALGVAGVANYIPATSGNANITFGDLIVQGDGGPVEDRTAVGTVHFGAVTLSAAGTFTIPIEGIGLFQLGNIITTLGDGEVTNPGGTQDYTDIPAPVFSHRQRFLSRNANTKMDSGRMRVRRIYDGPLQILEVQWSFTEDEFDVFKTWFEGDLRNGENPFFLTTFDILDDPHFIREVDWVLAFMAPPQFTGSDNSYVVSASLLAVEKAVIAQTIDNPTNPPPPGTGVPDLVITFDDFPCRDMFHMKATTLEPLKSHTIQIADHKDGPYRDHAYFNTGGVGIIDFTFNNDYRGKNWFRIKRNHDGAIVAKPANPQASVVLPPVIDITNVVEPQRPLWGDMAFYNKSATNQRMNPNSYFIVPRRRLCYNGGPTTGGDIVPRVVQLSGDPSAAHFWTRDNTDPTDATTHPKYDGVADNIAVQHADFGYALRARSYVPAGCRSPLTLVLVDKMLWQSPYTTAHGQSADEADTCDLDYTANIRVDWTRASDGSFAHPLESHKFVSGDSCDNYPQGLRVRIITDTRGGQAALSHDHVFLRNTIEETFYNKTFLGTGDAGDKYLGWDETYVSSNTFFAESIDLTRQDLTYNSFPPCFSYSTLGLGVANQTFPGDYILNDGEKDNEVMTGPNGTASKIVFSWNHPGFGQQKGPVDQFVQPLVSSNDDGESKYSAYLYLTLNNDNKAPKELPDPATIPPVPVPPAPPAPVDKDDFEEYPTFDAELIHYMDAGTGWNAAGHWVIETIVLTWGYETFETYPTTTLAAVGIDEPPASSGMNGGDGYLGEWVIKTTPAVIGLDTFEGYQRQFARFVEWADFDVLGSLSAGSGIIGYAGIYWDGFWLIKEGKQIYGYDNFEQLNLGVINDAFHSMAYGVNWGLYWVTQDTYGQIGSDDFELYGLFAPADESNQLGLGDRWNPSSYWKFRSAEAYGTDDFESYSTGTFTTGQAGVNWDPHSAWTIETI